MKKYIDLTKRELDNADKKDLVLVSVLSPIEAHGPHLPLKTDLLIASEVMKRTTDALPAIEFVELPVLCTGAQALPVSGSIGVRYRTIYNLLIDFGNGLRKAGFKKWVIFDNHGGPSHQLAEADAARKLKKRGFELVVPFIDIMYGMNTHDSEIGLDSGRDGSMLDSHAGTNETSLYLAIDENFNDISYGKYLPAKSLGGRLVRLIGSQSLGFNVDWISDKNHPSYIGEPQLADAESGEKMLAYHVKKSMDAIGGNYNHKLDYNWFSRFLLRIIG